jgi:hypothetical protein
VSCFVTAVLLLDYLVFDNRRTLHYEAGVMQQSKVLAGCGKLGIRVSVCLQAYRKSLKMGPALAAGVRRFSSKQHFSAAC